MGDVGGDVGARGPGRELSGLPSGLSGGDVARKRGEVGDLKKGETRGELCGEDAVISSALEKMKAVSVRLR